MKHIQVSLSRPTKTTPQFAHRRHGGILVLAAVMMILVFGLVAFAVDLGYIAVTKTELQTAADGAALAAAIEVVDGLGKAPLKTQSQMQVASRAAAVAVGAENSNGDLSATQINSNSDIRYGRIDWNAASQSWVKTWGATPANMVEVMANRNAEGSGGTRKLSLLFGGAVGMKKTSLSEKAVAGVLPGVGFKIASGSTVTIGALPIACDQDSWNALMAGTGSDNYTYNSSSKTVTSGADGVKELNIYPDPNALLPAGNRGTVDLGSENNSTADLARQILHGLNASDLSHFEHNTIRTDTGPLIVNGDTGISAGIKDELEAIKGQPRLMPIFSVVGSQQQAISGNASSSTGGVAKGKKTTTSATGNNVYYRVEKFVGVRIVYVQLTGQDKKVVIQPATFSSSAVIRGKKADTGTGDTYYAKPGLLE